MILNVNEEDVENYRERYGIKKLYTGQVKKLVDVEFCGDLRMAEETLDPPMYDVDELEDEFYSMESDFSDDSEDSDEEEDESQEEEDDD